MRIVLLNGSPRKNGATAKILHEFEQQLLTHNCSTEFVNISELVFSPCAGCCSCYKTGECYMKDDAESLSVKIAKADGVIIGSPTYVSNVSGQLKQFIDRGHFVIEQLLHGKYAVSVATGENYGNTGTSKVIVNLLKYSGAKMSGKVICKVPFNSIPKYVAKYHALADRLYNDIEHQKKYPLQSFIHMILFQLGIKPFVMGKGERYDGVLSRWKRSKVI